MLLSTRTILLSIKYSLSSHFDQIKYEDIDFEQGVRPAIWFSKNPIDSNLFHIGAYEEDTNDYTIKLGVNLLISQDELVPTAVDFENPFVYTVEYE